MKLTTASRLALHVAGNPVLSAFLTLMVLLVGVLTHSPPLIVASGILAFGRPILYCALLNAKAERPISMQSERRTSFDRRSSNRSIALDAR